MVENHQRWQSLESGQEKMSQLKRMKSRLADMRKCVRYVRMFRAGCVSFFEATTLPARAYNISKFSEQAAKNTIDGGSFLYFSKTTTTTGHIHATLGKFTVCREHQVIYIFEE